jgi:cysteinyl-tRNA synthetase
MAIKLYNTLSKKKETFTPLEKGRVKMYSCGPTVYDYASVGNMWAYLTADILRRFLEFSGYEVKQIKNITDVGHFTDDEDLCVSGEDKMDKAAKREKKTPLKIAEHYIKYFLLDEKKLHIKPPHFRPRPTQEIDAIITIIKDLIKKKFAYETKDGVYFAVKKFPNYGKLSGNTLKKIRSGARVAINEAKKNPADFALWIKKVGKNKKHSLHWDSPWGQGFPGWHIECTAMATRYLGDSLDIHTGGEDNIFPHHECEIAQSEAYTNRPFVKYWLHVRHFLMDGQKMSKSLGNILTVSPTPSGHCQDLETLGFHPLAFRTLKLASHYRSQANFTLAAMRQAQTNWERLNDFYRNLQKKCTVSPLSDSKKIDLDSYRHQFQKAMANDLNTPEALKIVLALVKKGNQLLSQNKLQNKKETKETLKYFDQIFALLLEEKIEKIPITIKRMAQERKSLKEKKQFQAADLLRQTIEKQGYQINDQKDGAYELCKK